MKMKIYIVIILLTMTSFSQNIVKKVYTNKVHYTYGDTALITIRAINESLVQDTIIFPNGCEAYPFIDDINYLNTFGILCGQIISPRFIPPSDSIEWVCKYPISITLLSTGQHSVFGHFVELLWDPYRAVISNTDTITFFVDEPNSIVNEQQKIILVLEQNYPNPFNPSTTISFSLEKQTSVHLIIYDCLGREIETLVQGIKSAGTYKIEWKPNNLSSGIYFYNLKTNEKSYIKKLVYIK